MAFNFNEYETLKREALKKHYSKMNVQQLEAIFKTEGPLLILAGAGSGKTTVLVNRIAYMMSFGNAYYATDISATEADVKALKDIIGRDDYSVSALANAVHAAPINPWNILAITFTNKAAEELKSRLSAMLGEDGEKVYAGTFHSICLRILRREIDKLGFTSNFSIYDTDTSLHLLKTCMSELYMNEKIHPPKSVLSMISRAKDSLMTPEQYAFENEADFRKSEVAQIYTLYQKRLTSNNALDFDDIICHTVRLLENDEDVLNHYQNLFKYIMVDEYQDTNHAQYQLVSLLSGKSQNLCVVGDDDQSIYRFRGATIENILTFEEEYKDATVIRLEQNYRSTQNILSAANELIKNNAGRKGKNLWTDSGDGDKIISYHSENEIGEANYVVNRIIENTAAGGKFSDNAILYRVNAQSSTMERALIRAGIPYKIFGGQKFFGRKEVKDILAYFQILVNEDDSESLKRVINEPKRGIGTATVNTIEEIASAQGISMYDVMRTADVYNALAKKSEGLKKFAEIVSNLKDIELTEPLDVLFDKLIEFTGYGEYLATQGEEGRARLENIEELKSQIIHFAEESEETTLAAFLTDVALYTDIDSMNDDEDKVILMTIHSAKGLEFPNVYIIGMEDGIFPGYKSMSEEDEVEEERRLAYVAITRAKRKLYLSYAAERMLYGRTNRNKISRFITEIPEDFVETIDDAAKARIFNGNKPRATYKPPIGVSVGVRKPVAGKVDYKKGDTVVHKVFGRGVVQKMQPIGGDILVEVAFEEKGVKKIMANFSKLEKDN